MFTNPVFICLALYGLAQQAQFGLAKQAQMFGYVQQPLAGNAGAGQIQVLQLMPLQSGPGQQQFSVQPGQFVRQQGLPQLSGPGVAQSSAVQGAALNLYATAFQPNSVNQTAPIQRAVSDSSGVTLRGPAQSERTVGAVTVRAWDEAAQARMIVAVSERGQAEPVVGEIKVGSKCPVNKVRTEGLGPGSNLTSFCTEFCRV